MENPFNPGDEAYILGAKVQVMSNTYVTATYVKMRGTECLVPNSILSFTPYTAQGITHEKPKPKPAGMFWDDDKSKGVYGVLFDEETGANYSFLDSNEEWFKNFQEMTFDEYRKLKQQIQIEKFAPLHDDEGMDALMEALIKLYSKISK